MAAAPRLLAIATAVPPYPLDQENVVERVKLLFGRSPDLDRLLPVFLNTGIQTRYSCVPIEWYDRAHGWPERNSIYLASALDLLEAATKRVLRLNGRDKSEIDKIVVVSTTGIATPSLDAMLIERMGLRSTVQRLPIFGLGCAGGVLGLARAASQAAAEPGETVLFLVVELCALSFRRDDWSKSNIVATALFGDGAAAALLSTDGEGPAIVASGEHTWPGSLDVMGWEVADEGLKAIFSRDIPNLVTTQLGDVASEFLTRHGLVFGDIDRFACHPGGAKVITALEYAFGLPEGALAEARAVLRDYGNMSAATVIFVLERILAKTQATGQHWERGLMTALGPGFTAGFLLIDNR
ncbi:MAG: type III polyketide synthase [Alphaproteobacteria bacterium]|nr:type III polyketide synthase [Alphaproteobacteria bacterium]MBV9198529.1 type III polyketide synthase [Alphaproteobacteria bacterium]MBV9377704.1 type III polyketide synthase [Alphaproteobacteria bacterium]MBV9815240.1 type III polyketide synthase [Alphaproteobacteria bacterium]